MSHQEAGQTSSTLGTAAGTTSVFRSLTSERVTLFWTLSDILSIFSALRELEALTGDEGPPFSPSRAGGLERRGAGNGPDHIMAPVEAGTNVGSLQHSPTSPRAAGRGRQQ